VKKKGKLILVIFLAAIILRFVLIFSAYHGDLNNNITWGTIAAEGGLSGFYEGRGLSSVALAKDGWPYSAPNQPPLTIITLAVVREIWQVVENSAWWMNNNIPLFPSPFIWFWESKGMTLLVKLPGILADLGIGWVIYQYFRKNQKNELGIKLSAIWLFNPIIWYNSSIWGQTDSVVNLLGMIGIFGLLNRRLLLFSVFFTLSVLFKGSLIIFSPILFIVVLMQKYSLKELFHAVFYMLLTTVFISIWFHPQLDLPLWLINLYKDRILPGEIGYLTANAFNFWWLVDSGKVPDGTLFLGLTARAWGFTAAIGGMVGVGYWLLKKKLSDKRIFLSLIFISLVTFLFMTRIHERYLYPLFPYATILLGIVPGISIAYIILSLTHLLNLYHLFWSPSFASLESLYVTPLFAQIISVINILVFFYLLRLYRSR